LTSGFFTNHLRSPAYPGSVFSIFFKFADTGGKFADGVIAITIDLWKGVTTGVIDTSCKAANSANDAGGIFASSAHLGLPISSQIFEKNLNGSKETSEGPGEDDS
jgi:hypothetical protein